MKVKNILPTVITDHIVSTAAEFEKFGFVQKHHLLEENMIEVFVMESENGSRTLLMSPPKAGVKIGSGFTVIVDDIDETVAYFSANGFRTLTGVIPAAHTKIVIMLWEAVNTMVCVMQHVKA